MLISRVLSCCCSFPDRKSESRPELRVLWVSVDSDPIDFRKLSRSPEIGFAHCILLVDLNVRQKIGLHAPSQKAKCAAGVAPRTWDIARSLPDPSLSSPSQSNSCKCHSSGSVLESGERWATEWRVTLLAEDHVPPRTAVLHTSCLSHF